MRAQTEDELARREKRMAVDPSRPGAADDDAQVVEDLGAASPGKHTLTEDERGAAAAEHAPVLVPGRRTLIPVEPTAPPLPVAAADVVARAPLFRRETAAAANASDPAVIEALSGGGAPLPDDVQRRMAARFGIDFHLVRIHTDDAADRAARALSARAFTTGDQIYFARGAFDPGSSEGEHLLVHELTHVVQAYEGRTGAASGRVSDPSEPLEREAEAMASGALTPPRAVATEPAAAPAAVEIFRFYPPEHVSLGDEATGKESTDIEVQFDNGTTRKLTFGELVALADCFDSVADIKAKAALKPAIAVQYALSWKLGIGSEPAGNEAIKKEVRDHILEILATNMDHFGDEAKGNYKKDHTEALTKAFEAGAGNDQAVFGEAVALEAFSQHYLSDLFAGGHIRTPRREIKDWYDSHFPHSNDMFVNNMTDWLVRFFESKDAIPWWVPDSKVAERVRANILTMGGKAISTSSVGDIVGAAHHNLDNLGLQVVSDVDENGNVVQGGYHWESKGDDHLKESAVTRKMAVAAMAASRKELDAARDAGKKAAGGKYTAKPELLAARDAAIKTMQPYRAEKFLPREDKASSKNKQYNWEWGNLDNDLAAEVGRLVQSNLIGMLKTKAAEQPETKVIDEDVAYGAKHLHMELPLRAAILDYCTHLDTNPLHALVEILGGVAAQPPPPKPKVGAWDSEDG